MADRMTREQRHRCMSRIRGRDTKPELVVRRWLWHQGFRYRLYVKSLPGRPDIVMRKWRTVIFVNGCFWHVIVIWECQLTPKNRHQTLRELDLALSRIILEKNGARPQRYTLPDHDDIEAPVAAESTTAYGKGAPRGEKA